MSELKSNSPAPLAHTRSVLSILLVIAKRVRFLIIVPLLFSIITVIYCQVTDPIYTATARILPPQYNENTVMAMQNQLGGESQLGNSALTLKNPTDLFVGILTSRTIRDGVIANLNLSEYYGEEDMGELRETLYGRTQIRAGKDGIVSIFVDDVDREKAAELANAYINQFYTFSQDLARQQSVRRVDFYNNALEAARRELEEADSQLSSSEKKTGFTRLLGQDQAIVLAAAELQAQISARQIQLQTMSSYATSSNPDVRLIQNELKNLEAELASLQAGAASKESPLKNTEPFVGLGAVPETMLEHTQRRRDVRYWEDIVMLLGRLSEMGKIDERRDLSLFQVLDWAVPPHDKSKPRTKVNAILAALGTGFICLIWVLLQAHVEQRRASCKVFNQQWLELTNALFPFTRKSNKSAVT